VPDLIATIDTSVLVSLQSAELPGAVSVLFNRILVPVKVRQELKDGGERNHSALKAIEEFAIFKHCDDYDRELVQLLLQTRKHLKKGRDEGEAEAVIQAAHGPAKMVLTDDELGRTWARRHTRDCHGTIWICYQLRHTGFIRELRPYYVRMLQRGRRQPRMEMNKYLQELGEPLISQQEYSGYMKK
jgi:predicted nucleic acid-binding protein